MKKIQDINIYKEPKVKNPVLLAAWPGMGAVASQAVDYIRLKVGAEFFAEIDTRSFNIPYSVMVTDGVGVFPPMSRILLFYSEKYDLLFCEGEEQFSGKAALKVADNLLGLSKDLNVKHIFTGAAFVQHMNHRDTPSVFAVANSIKMRDFLVYEKGVNFLRRGQISGLNGSLLGFAAQKGIDAACFLATIPIYAVNIPNPKAAREIVSMWSNILDIQIDLSDFDEPIKESDNALNLIEEQLKKLALSENVSEAGAGEMPKIDKNSDVPPFVREHIEQLFEKAKKDKTIAHKLKEELDRWDLFKEYEDRFLDLFKDNQ